MNLRSFHVIGFDMDHTLVRYKLGNLYRLVYNCLASYLVKEKGYTTTLLSGYENHAPDLMQKGLVFDMKRGNFLKLAADGFILRASHGTKRLETKAIEREYGESRVWAEHALIRDSIRQVKGYWFFDNYFSLPGIVISALLVDDVDINSSQSASYDFFPDLLSSFGNAFNITNFRTGKGGYFFAIRSNPSHYVYPMSDKVKTWLHQLKQSSRLFFMTSSHSDYTRFLMGYAYGPNWSNLFDVIIVDAKKPGFFIEPLPFFKVGADDVTDDVIVPRLEKGKIYAQGSESVLKEFLREMTCRESPDIVYVGDNIKSDIIPPTKFDGWKTVAIVEEMEDDVINDDDEPSPKKSMTRHSMWGSCLRDDVDEGRKTLVADLVNSYSSLAVPSVDSLAETEGARFP
ncbi:5'-nucleotidase domain-containing protein 1-like [Oscarella lobularis]|uniref:5'-nucleotidase domain-containing protein 1-like n=1 Tax=Oscarella lobularis TaxID=121494 RepID=UPI00331314D5